MGKDMNSDRLADLEDSLIGLGRSFPYPPTPTLVARFRENPGRRWSLVGIRLAVVLILVLGLAGGLLAVPQVRAAVVEYIQLGAIRIRLEALFTGSQEDPRRPADGVEGIAAPGPSFSIENWQALAGELSLKDATKAVGFELPMPGYPENLGPPDKVFLQENPGTTVVMIWAGPGTDEVQLSLLVLGPGAFAGKEAPDRILRTSVRGREALWLEGEHQLVLLTGDPPQEDLFRVSGNVLIWEEAGRTYRLEGQLTLEEAARIAESIP